MRRLASLTPLVLLGAFIVWPRLHSAPPPAQVSEVAAQADLDSADTLVDFVVVAVIDTGVAYENHGQFKRAKDLDKTEFVPGYNFVADNEHANDDHGHGTHVAGTIAQSTHNGIGVAGVAYKARIMPLKVLSAGGSGSVAGIAQAVRWAADHGAQVINMSLGGPMYAQVLARAVRYAH